MVKENNIGFGEGAINTSLKFLVIACASIGISIGMVVAHEDDTSKKMYEVFDRNNFDDPTNINNEWMPLKPGMRYIYEGTSLSDEGELLAHRIEINVTDLKKVIDGVETIVSWDLDYSEEQLVEAELAFFAQDNDGNVWRMGEYPVEYEDGEVVAAPCWLSGIEDAVAGISMMGEPRLGSKSYSQGWGPAVDFTDRGRVDQMGLKTCVPLDCYEDVLVIAETSLEEPDAFQLKYWAKGVGNIRVGWRGEGEKTQEILELVEIVELNDESLAEVRTKALELEKHAYEISKNVYGQTSPLTVLGE